MTSSWEESQEAFAEAAGWFVRTAALVGDRWQAPGLGEWDVRSLVGHTSRSMLTAESALAAPAPRVDVASAPDYYRATRSLARGPEVAQRGRDAGVGLGDDPAGAVAGIAARVVPLVRGADGREPVTTIAGGMRLADYLPTRTFELVVHTADLAAALAVTADVPPAAGTHALRLVAALAVVEGLAVPLLLAATGRSSLPPGFSVL